MLVGVVVLLITVPLLLTVTLEFAPELEDRSPCVTLVKTFQVKFVLGVVVVLVTLVVLVVVVGVLLLLVVVF